MNPQTKLEFQSGRAAPAARRLVRHQPRAVETGPGQPMSRVATIDIGTNTTLLLVAEASSGTISVLEDRATITRLAAALARMAAGPGGIDRTLAALSGYAVLARVHEAPIFAIGTEALRRAPNAADFLCRAAALLDTPVEVIGGEREAALTFLAAKQSFPEAAAQTMVVVDIGGGSTEIVVTHRGAVDSCRSLPLGSVRLTERHIHHDPPLADESPPCVPRSPSTWPKRPSLPKPTSPACWRGRNCHDPCRHGAGSAQLRSGAGSRLSSDPASPGRADRSPARLDPKPARSHGWSRPLRADVILSGAIILGEIARRVGSAYVLVSDRGIRWGLLYEKLGNG